MIPLLVVLLVVWAGLVVIGLAVKSLLWLTLVGAALFLVTAVTGLAHHRKGT